MKVVVAYHGRLRDCVKLAVEKYDPWYVLHEEETSYFYLLKRLWEKQETFILLEGDNLPWPGALEQLWECPERWCAFPYRLSYDGGYSTALGCTKFGTTLMKAAPQLFDLVESKKHYAYPGDPKNWWGLDGRMFATLGVVAQQGWAHRHMPPIVHLNPVQNGSRLAMCECP